MGEFSGTPTAIQNLDMGGEQKTDSGELKGYPTDVDGVMANDVVKQGTNDFPCFDVSREEFYQNMEGGRKRLRFKSETAVQKYMSGSKYNRSFYVRHTDDNGKVYVRKVK